MAFSLAKIPAMAGRHEFLVMKVRMVRGPSFCHVLKIMQLIHDIDAITDGNQKWHGAIPIFSMIAAMIRYEGGICIIFVHKEADAIRIILDPRA
jgi:gamma-glutamyl phosphate reductase